MRAAKNAALLLLNFLSFCSDYLRFVFLKALATFLNRKIAIQEGRAVVEKGTMNKKRRGQGPHEGAKAKTIATKWQQC